MALILEVLVRQIRVLFECIFAKAIKLPPLILQARHLKGPVTLNLPELRTHCLEITCQLFRALIRLACLFARLRGPRLCRAQGLGVALLNVLNGHRLVLRRPLHLIHEPLAQFLELLLVILHGSVQRILQMLLVLPQRLDLHPQKLPVIIRLRCRQLSCKARDFLHCGVPLVDGLVQIAQQRLNGVLETLDRRHIDRPRRALRLLRRRHVDAAGSGLRVRPARHAAIQRRRRRGVPVGCAIFRG